MREQESTNDVLHQPCLHPVGMIRLLRALAKREEEKRGPRTWWERLKDMWRSVK